MSFVRQNKPKWVLRGLRKLFQNFNDPKISSCGANLPITPTNNYFFQHPTYKSTFFPYIWTFTPHAVSSLTLSNKLLTTTINVRVVIKLLFRLTLIFQSLLHCFHFNNAWHWTLLAVFMRKVYVLLHVYFPLSLKCSSNNNNKPASLWRKGNENRHRTNNNDFVRQQMMRQIYWERETFVRRATNQWGEWVINRLWLTINFGRKLHLYFPRILEEFN